MRTYDKFHFCKITHKSHDRDIYVTQNLYDELDPKITPPLL